MALGLKHAKSQAKVYVALGDGEIQEGQIREAAATASKYGLDNLVVIVDNNGIQNDGFTNDIMPNRDIAKKFEAFGWQTLLCKDHDMGDLLDTFEKAKLISHGPLVIVADTVKGQGVSFMANVPAWHGIAPNVQEYDQAMQEVGGRRHVR